jgi:MraZ protein
VDQTDVLRGTHTARIDDKGRLKIPTAFRQLIQERYGPQLFVTSVTGEHVTVYPMPIWVAQEEKLAKMPSTHPARVKYLQRVSYFGQTAEIDAQGRVVLHPRVRDAAGMMGEVDVFGQYDCLDIWNHERFAAKLQGDPYTTEDARALAEFGI